MSLILNFETSSKNCSVTLSSKGELLSNFDLEDDKYRHSELLTTTIRDILSQNNLIVKDLSAVAIGIGPGSFTGLRIGFSVAKGLCYPHKINLIGISSLKILANSIKSDSEYIIPMINDKGDFYYLSTFENGLNELGTPLIDKVDSNFINRNIKEDSTIVVNNKESFEYINSIINDQVKLQYKPISSINMINLSYESFKEKRFKNLAYSEPLYVKKPYIT
ncbi:MAG: tRNA (adenosine(37)-N6)-threonylcarbamoyltransferase complex dimerization subunit type 1 TsaB [Flavobacteriaceae bacterium]|nr:tRNA (adenosine(37)-N6)-threonylcarbamoyltransferase complex dimerization subunit type 1 TsaB [Cryomorphaceae bacterium]MBL6677776.1 tRNA (adenosine(37)-N6)-threonylcarbamoyltransferase complex dimerization subunit type 1 TsaB [Flavobacteriaceae bacterium]MDA0330991.1 tRNA (adenosine(37)-N6)-threonylcarbamoyltransferase complex dimerization subunit type 1 TsaB [Bacteroidota bacterium]MDA1225810.1 tRNA (adenosine(37)-N6)-threonylcarbamoyltransferase complex dimerization subunit type 1 TsaB [Ba